MKNFMFIFKRDNSNNIIIYYIILFIKIRKEKKDFFLKSLYVEGFEPTYKIRQP